MGSTDPMRRIPGLIALFMITFLLMLSGCGSSGDRGGAESRLEPEGLGPEGSLSEKVVITVEPISAPPTGMIGKAYKFGPEGITFDLPVTISIIYAEANLPSGVGETDVHLGKWVNDQWQRIFG